MLSAALYPTAEELERTAEIEAGDRAATRAARAARRAARAKDGKDDDGEEEGTDDDDDEEEEEGLRGYDGHHGALEGLRRDNFLDGDGGGAGGGKADHAAALVSRPTYFQRCRRLARKNRALRAKLRRLEGLGDGAMDAARSRTTFSERSRQH